MVRGARASRRPRSSADLTLPRYREPARRREPGDVDAGPRVHARDDRAVRRGRLAGLLAQAARERRARRRRLGGRVLRALLGRCGQQGQAPDRRLLRIEPAGRGDLPRSADRRRRRPASCRARCFRQIEFAGVLRGARNEEGARKLVDFMLSKRFQEDIPLQMFVFPARREAALPPEFEQFAVVPKHPPRALSPPRSRRTASAGWTSGRTSWFGERPRTWRAVTYGVPLAFLGAVLPLSAARHPRARTARGWRSAARRPHRSADARGRVVHPVAGARVDRADDPRRVPRGLRPRPLPIPRTQPRRRARRRPVRAPDGGRGARVPRDPPRRHRARMGADPRSRTRSSTSPSSCGSSGRSGRTSIRACPRRRRRSAPARSPGSARSRAAARPRARRGRSDRLPLLVHVVRDRPHPRRPAVRDDRGGDLQPGRPPLRPARSRRPLDRAARVRRRGRVGRDAARAATGGAGPAARRAGHAPAGAHARARESSSVPVSVALRSSSGCRSQSSSSAPSRSAAGIRLDAYRALGRPDECPPRRSVGGRRELDRVRVRRDRDRRSSSAGLPRSPSPTSADRGSSTA